MVLPRQVSGLGSGLSVRLGEAWVEGGGMVRGKVTGVECCIRVRGKASLVHDQTSPT